MKKNLAMKWANALRSGKYKQGKFKLYRKDYLSGEEEYCCLGVLDKLCGSKNIKAISRDATLPESLIKFPLLNTSDGEITSLGFITLSALNDEGIKKSIEDNCNEENKGPLNFDEIADIIQICYKEL